VKVVELMGPGPGPVVVVVLVVLVVGADALLFELLLVAPWQQ